MAKSTNRIGGTLVEVVVAALISGVLLVPVLKMLGYTATSYSKQAILDRANLLSVELMSEILSKDFQDRSGSFSLGPDPGESLRLDFDDLDDYHKLNEQPPTKPSGAEIPGAAQFRRFTTVQYSDSAGIEGSPAQATFSQSSLKQITIEIYFRDKLIKTLYAISTKNGLTESTVDYGGKTTEKVSANLRMGSQAVGLSSSTRILNRIPEEINRD